jgi:hypothetical protein
VTTYIHTHRELLEAEKKKTRKRVYCNKKEKKQGSTYCQMDSELEEDLLSLSDQMLLPDELPPLLVELLEESE